MANFLLIRELCELKKITIRELASRIGKEDSSIQAIVRNGYDATLLNGIVVLIGTAKEVQKDGSIKEVPFKAIPYSTWNNRGSDQMSVWIPEAESERDISMYLILITNVVSATSKYPEPARIRFVPANWPALVRLVRDIITATQTGSPPETARNPNVNETGR